MVHLLEKPATSFIEEAIAAKRNQLVNHPLYASIQTLEDLKRLMRVHVFAVLDFMTLLKGLQQQLTCVQLPWMPTPNGAIRRFINEIVLEEESDIDMHGNYRSHFEMYKEAMQALGIDMEEILQFSFEFEAAGPDFAIKNLKEKHPPIGAFVEFTWSIANSEKAHLMAGVFTYGREDLIPDMFIQFVKQTVLQEHPAAKALVYYLERHIELDGEHHAPLAKKMVDFCCDGNPVKIQEAAQAAKEALEKRIALWDYCMQ